MIKKHHRSHPAKRRDVSDFSIFGQKATVISEWDFSSTFKLWLYSVQIMNNLSFFKQMD